jgi:glycosyltransferase involved in cell wall biosynthesis
MRIAEVNDVAWVATELSAALRELGHESELLHPRLFGASLPPWLKPAVGPVRFADWLRLARQLRAGHYDGVHIHYAYLGVVGILARVPYVLHCHGDDVRDLRRPLRKPIIRQALLRAEHVFYSTPDLAPLVTAIRADAEFLPNPVDTALFQPAELDADASDMLVACSLSANKGVANILESVRMLVAERPAIRITAIAQGEAVSAFDAIPNVTLVSHQLRWKLPALIARHRVVVGQAHKGAIGMVELEAMSCGRPLVARFELSSVYSEPPPIVNARTGAEIAAAVGGLLDDPAHAQDVGAHSREWILRRHDRRLVAARVVEVFAGRDPTHRGTPAETGAASK